MRKNIDNNMGRPKKPFTHTITYSSWQAMKERCMNPNHKYSKYYGHLKVDCKWLSIEGFVEDMGERPSIDHCIDRINPNEGYNKLNCRWITKFENIQRVQLKHGLSGTLEYHKVFKDKINERKRAWRTKRKAEGFKYV